MVEMPMAEARGQLRALVRATTSGHQRVTITDHGRPAAVLMSAEEFAVIEEALAIAEHLARRATRETAPRRPRLNVAPGQTSET